MNDKLKKLEELLKLANDGLTREEFVVAFQEVIKFVEKLSKTNSAEFESLHKAFDILSAKVKEDAGLDLADVRKECQKMMDSMMKENTSTMNFLRDKVRSLKSGKDGEDGVSPSISDIVPAVLAQIPEDPEETPQETRDKLESLQGDERLDKTAVKGIEQIEEKISQIELRPANVGGAKGIGLYIGGSKKLLTAQQINLIAGTGITISYASASGRNDITITATGTASLTPIAVTGTIDDSNVSFTAASAPNLVIVNGASYRNGHGCTIVGTAITLDNPVGVGGDIYCL